MSEMTGIEAAIEVRKVLPNCKVLLLSGNERTAKMLKDAHEGGHDFEILAKPVHPAEIRFDRTCVQPIYEPQLRDESAPHEDRTEMRTTQH